MLDIIVQLILLFSAMFGLVFLIHHTTEIHNYSEKKEEISYLILVELKCLYEVGFLLPGPLDPFDTLPYSISLCRHESSLFCSYYHLCNFMAPDEVPLLLRLLSFDCSN